MRTPTCKECNTTGTVHIEGAFISQPMDITCWICKGTALKGMNLEQAKWYLKQYKILDKITVKSLKAGEVSDVIGYATVKQAINKACAKLGIALQTVPPQKAIEFGETVAELFLRAELKEYERRLTAIPVTLANRMAAAA